ncbi:hypothetical protein [Parasphingorhabdus sp.]|uniref:hypothetical protein n=1 Tax=Parasphingorhabdus sp. TaxID=2709688 RepID=UPI003BAF1B4E
MRAHTTGRRRAVQGCRLCWAAARRIIAMMSDLYGRRGSAGVVFRLQRDGVDGAPG